MRFHSLFYFGLKPLVHLDTIVIPVSVILAQLNSGLAYLYQIRFLLHCFYGMNWIFHKITIFHSTLF
jgi:hypothetical protein